MNRGLVVNSDPLARVWSPLLAIVLLVLLFPTLYLKAALIYRCALLSGVALSRSVSRARISGRLTERAKLNPQTPGSGRERFQIKARHPKCCSKARTSRLRPEGSSHKAHEFGPRGAELVKAGVGGRASRVRNRPKTPIPEGTWAAATNRDMSDGFGPGASVRRRAPAPKEDFGTSCLQKGED